MTKELFDSPLMILPPITCNDPNVIGGGQGSHFYVVRGIRPSGTRVSFNRMGQLDFAVQPGQ